MKTLVIGNRNYSSWSLRAWLFMKQSGLDFDVVRLSMFTDDWAERVAEYSPAGRVPVLVDGPLRVWDSMAIIEHILETHARSSHPSLVGWPEDLEARAQARSVAAEMHSGFLAVRDELPQNIRRRTKLNAANLSESCQLQIARIFETWATCRQLYADRGPWLFGKLSVPDIVYAPVALRFRTYGIAVPPPADEYLAAVCSLPALEEWCAAALDEPESLPFVDDLVPAEDSPLTLG